MWLYNLLKSMFLRPGDYVEEIGAISRLLHYSHVQSVGGYGQHRERGRGSIAVWIWHRSPSEYPDASSRTLRWPFCFNCISQAVHPNFIYLHTGQFPAEMLVCNCWLVIASNILCWSCASKIP